MNSGTDIRPPCEMHSSEVFSFALEDMPDKIAGQAQFSASFGSSYFIGKTGS
jgi:hypothetical protein